MSRKSSFTRGSVETSYSVWYHILFQSLFSSLFLQNKLKTRSLIQWSYTKVRWNPIYKYLPLCNGKYRVEFYISLKNPWLTALQQLTVSQIIEIIIYCPNVPLYINVVYARQRFYFVWLKWSPRSRVPDSPAWIPDSALSIPDSWRRVACVASVWKGR